MLFILALLLFIGPGSAYRGVFSNHSPVPVTHLNANLHFEPASKSKFSRDKDAVRRPTSFKPTNLPNEGTRLNKCVLGLSRRAADEAISAGQVSVNSAIASCGTKVNRGDVVRFNGKIQNWQDIASAKLLQPPVERERRKAARRAQRDRTLHATPGQRDADVIDPVPSRPVEEGSNPPKGSPLKVVGMSNARGEASR